MSRFSDEVSIVEVCDLADAGSKIRTTADGYLVATPRIARTGIQIYNGAEVGRPEMPQVRIYRPPEEVFRDFRH